MRERIYAPRLFKLQAASMDWDELARRLNFTGDPQPATFDPAEVQLRWLLKPELGLPLEPFTVWSRVASINPADMPMQEIIHLPDWQELEIVGLPVDDSWEPTGYSLSEQGQLSSLKTPLEAALNRLNIGAPRIGWADLFDNGVALPGWEAVNLDAYLADLLRSPMLAGIRDMLVDLRGQDPTTQITYQRTEDGSQFGLIGLAQSNGVNQPANTTWHPLGVMTIAAGSDPLASLALGFGTGVFSSGEEMYMVTIKHPANDDLELADVVLLDNTIIFPEPPQNLSAAFVSHNRPAFTDAPGIETLSVRWDRPVNAAYSENSARPPYSIGALVGTTSYAIGRFGPASGESEILLNRRPDEVRGWSAYTHGRISNSVLYPDYLRRSPLFNPQAADPLPGRCTYAVAAQDIFGRWSQWRTVIYDIDGELPQIPAILAVQIDPDQNLIVDFGWDWSDRSPEFVEFIGMFEDNVAFPLWAARLFFGGSPQPTLNVAQTTVIPLDKDRKPISPPVWGAAQDVSPAEPGVRFYRLTTSQFSPNLSGHLKRVFQIHARAQCHVHQQASVGWNISLFGPFVKTTIYDQTVPEGPQIPPLEIPQWASLPDPSGVSRAVLRWPGTLGVSYILYEATETTLLVALNQSGPDTAEPLIFRLDRLRHADLSSLRDSFRRVQTDLIPSGVPITSFEVTLPRGSTVLHFYALTAINANGKESNWPDTSQKFFAVAAPPRQVIPFAPILEAAVDQQAAPPTVTLSMRFEAHPAVTSVELYRVNSESLATNVDTMGPPIRVLNVNGPELTFIDDTMAPGWRRRWYRAVAWSSDVPETGQISARSPAAPAVSVLVPPNTPPDLHDLKVYKTAANGMEVMVSWSTNMPRFQTPLGFHRFVIAAANAAQTITTRIAQSIDAVTRVNDALALPPAEPDHQQIYTIRGTYYAWVPRPVQDQPFTVTVKAIDPLGRISSAEIEVPPTSILPPPELSPMEVIMSDQNEGNFFDWMGLVVIGWRILSPVDTAMINAYEITFRVDFPDPMVDHPCISTVSLGDMLVVSEVDSLRPVLDGVPLDQHGIYRIAFGNDQQPYVLRAWCPSAGFDYDLKVTLTDPNGQTAEQRLRLGE